MEAATIKMAREYGAKPWEVFEECTRDWWVWQVAYWQAEAQVQHQLASEVKRRGKHG